MTDHHPQASQQVGPPPTPRQQRYVPQLALERGVSFVPPRTCSEASRTIDQVVGRAPDSRADRRREIRAVQDDLDRGGERRARTRGGGVHRLRLQRILEARRLVTILSSESTVRRGATNAPVELARYTIRAGERVIYGQHRRTGRSVRRAPRAGRGAVRARPVRDRR
jgi:hypothetical protein